MKLRTDVAYAAISVAVTGVATAVMVMTSPVLGTMAVLAILSLWFLVAHPKLLALTAVLGITFSRTFEKVSGQAVVGYLDEGLVLLAVGVLAGGRLLHGRRLRGIPGGGFFLGFLALGLLSAFLHDVTMTVALQGTFLVAKAILLAWSVAQVDWTVDDLRRGMRPLAIVASILVAGAAVNLVVPQAWADVFQTLGYVQYRVAGLPSIISVTTHPLDLGALATFSAIAAVAYRTHVQKTLVGTVLIWGTVLSTILTFRRASIAALAGSLALVPLRRYRTGSLIFGAVLIPAGILALWQSIESVLRSTYVEYFLDPDGTARTVLTRDSFEVAASYFPFGAGFSRFGSYLAGVEYSPEYVSRGYDRIYGMGPGEKGRFLTDTQWPAIIGESGFVGAICFLIAIFLVIRRFWLLRNSQEPLVRWMSATGAGWVLSISVMSIAAPAFYSSTFFGAVFGLVGVVSAFSHRSVSADVLSTSDEIHQSDTS